MQIVSSEILTFKKQMFLFLFPVYNTLYYMDIFLNFLLGNILFVGGSNFEFMTIASSLPFGP